MLIKLKRFGRLKNLPYLCTINLIKNYYYMSTKKLFTANYGIVTVKDVMIDTDGTNLIEGIDVMDENGKFIIEVSGYCTDDVTDGLDVETIISDNEE